MSGGVWVDDAAGEVGINAGVRDLFALSGSFFLGNDSPMGVRGFSAASSLR